MSDTRKITYVLEDWFQHDRGTMADSDCIPIPFSAFVRAWCLDGKKVRVTFEVVEEEPVTRRVPQGETIEAQAT